jgi:hypothetical protein
MTETAGQSKGGFNFSVMATLPELKRKPNGEAVALPPYEETEAYWLDMREQKRNELIARVRTRELTKEQAEALAIKARVGPLASRLPNITKLRADMIFWSVEMTAAWIKALNIKAFHRQYGPSYDGILVWAKIPEFRRSVWGPKPKPSEARYDLLPLEKPQFGVGYVDFDGETRQLPNVEEFFPKLRTFLSTGEISAVGQPKHPPAEDPEISPGFWETADFNVTDEDGACLSIDGAVIYRKIVFNAPQLIKFYPPSVASRLRIRSGRVFPWREDIELSERYKIRIVDKLRALFPRGLPDWGPQKVRDGHLLEALGPDLTKRWWHEPDGPEGDKEFKENAFRVAMDRLLKEAHEDEVVIIENFY